MMDQTTRLLAGALEAAYLRQEVYAHNLANLNTPGFKRFQVEFEAELRRATGAGTGAGAGEVEPRVTRDTGTSGRPDGNNIDMEREMALLAENQVRYAALVRQMTDHFSRIRLAIFEGRR